MMYDNYDRDTLRRELAQEAMLDTVRRKAPVCCRNCDNLVIGVEDNRYLDEFGMAGDIDYFPKCALTNEEVFNTEYKDQCELIEEKINARTA